MTTRDEIEITAYVDDAGYLCAIDTGEILREATDEEEAESRDAGPTGAIRVTVPRVLSEETYDDIDEEFEMDAISSYYWKTVGQAVSEVLADMAAGVDPEQWCDPTDSKWWSECPQLGELDPTECAEAYQRLTRRSFPPERGGAR